MIFVPAELTCSSYRVSPCAGNKAPGTTSRPIGDPSSPALTLSVQAARPIGCLAIPVTEELELPASS